MRSVFAQFAAQAFCFIGAVCYVADVEAQTSLAMGPRVEVDGEMLARARTRLSERAEPFWSYWQRARLDAIEAMSLEADPSD